MPAFTYTGALQTLTIPGGVCRVTIQAQGAAGGSNLFYSSFDEDGGGLGASIQGTFAVAPGDVLSIVVGGQGGDTPDINEPNGGGGGGGGSFVWQGSSFGELNPSTLLVAAGGGGGGAGFDFGEDDSGSASGGSGMIGSIGQDGGNAAGGFGAGGTAGNGGSGGNGGMMAGLGGGGGGGGGINFNGGNGFGNAGGDGGVSIVAGGAGGAGGVGAMGDYIGGDGGFGGGGGGSDRNGGGGGGFSGGGGGTGVGFFVAAGGGGGGGSFNGGTNPVHMEGVRAGNGIVEIIYEAPTLTCSNITVANDRGACGANVTYNELETCPGLDVTCSPASGSFFSVGTTTVTCTAMDTVGGSTTCRFIVTVIDTEPPEISGLNDIDVETNDPNGTVVTYPDPIVTDNCPGEITVTCSPASGSFFPFGMTTVTCTATDPSGNTATETFTVFVTSSQEE
ncbi:HYR domain-containing protein [Marininema halotolerans]|uniref:HYR domain-containing protein n=1 Tax=Marininema halotolerans TaxID=1155944 RepID=A0A1I6S693_9BACL|nr:HYR domain-containing protein [Marininema halotolerans]SFS72298.1 HYR domain-containing protein [Marininema halotolerans]